MPNSELAIDLDGELEHLIANNLSEQRARIAEAARRAGRAASEVRLIAVSKKQSPAAIVAAYRYGQRDFGENYAQELKSKASTIALPDLNWHMIGHLQSNKAKDVAPSIAYFHAADSASVVVALNQRAAAVHKQVAILIEVNVARDPAKTGCSPEQLPRVLDAIRCLPQLRLVGLMTMPPHSPNVEHARPVFAALKALQDAHGGAKVLPELSMGMSSDVEVAIEEGATIVRLGTAIFGARPSVADAVVRTR